MAKSLCDLHEKLLEEDFDAYTKLVKKPKYVCTKCGRAARKKKNLCKAKKM